MPATINHPTIHTKDKDGRVNPAQVNRHALAEPWEYDPDYKEPEQPKKKKEKKDAEPV